MATARPPSGTGGGPTARLGFDLSALRAAPNVAREAGRAIARELSTALRVVQEQERQVTAVIKGQQAQATAVARSEGSARAAAARAEATERQQAARRDTIAFAEEEKRKTAAFRSELRAREQANRQSQVSAGAFGQGVASFAGAALGGPLGGLAGAVAGGSPALAAGLVVSEGGRFAIESAQTATAYDRQHLAAVNLAGSQARLNELLMAYGRASGGAVDKATALSNVTRLQAVGFADNAEEVDRFTRGVRGSSIAMGKLQDEISQEVQLAISNQSFKRLDQIGLGIAEVNARIDQLRASNQGMTREAAFQEAVLDLLNEKYGALTDSAVGAATGIERAAAAWRDFQLELGQTATQGASGGFFDFWARGLENTTKAIDEIDRKIQRSIWRFQGLDPDAMEFAIASDDRAINAAQMVASKRAGRRGSAFDEDQVAALRRREEGFAEIDRAEAEARQEATRSYERQRTQTIAEFEKQRVREAEDFGRQRANAERRHNLAILDVHQDSARQRVRWQEESERTIAKARQDTAKRLADLDEDFKKDQARREKDFRDDQLSAAGRLDAIALLELRKDRARELQDRQEAHEEQRADLHEQLAEREREERESLQRRIDEQRENDRLRIEEMKAAFAEQQAQEDIERGIRLERQAEDHQSQLDQLATAHSERIQQIKDHAQTEREQFTEESNKFLEDVGIHNQKWLDEQEKINDGVIRRHEELLAAERRSLLGQGYPGTVGPADRNMIGGADTRYIPPTPPAVYNPRGGWEASRSVSFTGDITILGGTNMTRQELYGVVVEALEDMAGGSGGRREFSP